jgi:hypothetical protein
MIKRIKNSLIYRFRYKYTVITIYFWNFITKILTSNKRDKSIRKSLYVWVPVWGEKHIDWFFKFTLSSLLKANNLPLVSVNKEVQFHFYTKDVDVKVIESRMKIMAPSYKFTIVAESFFDDMARDMMSNFFIHIINSCIKNKALMLIAQPDLIFSNGSVNNLVELSDGKGVSIAVAHPRVSYESLLNEKIDIESLSEITIDMVNVALKTQHKVLMRAEETNDENSTLMGISTRKMPNGLAIIHNLPAVYLCNPVKADLLFFKRRCEFNIIDKHWPNLLFRQSRLKIIGSSDLAFIIELTFDSVKTKLNSDLKFNDKHNGSDFLKFMNVFIHHWRNK